MSKQRTGNRPGQGRQPTVAPRGEIATVSVRLAHAQKEKFLRLGGAPWLRRMIDTASVPEMAEDQRETLERAEEEPTR